jgi:magnesium transporter
VLRFNTPALQHSSTPKRTNSQNHHPMSSKSLPIQIRTLLAEKKWAELKQLSLKLEASETASLFDTLAPAESTLLYRSLPTDLAADVFSFLEDEAQQRLLREMTEQETRTLLQELSPDDRTELFEELPAVTTQRLLNLLAAEDRKEALMLLGYPKESVGRLMSPDFVTVRPEQTVAEALDSIRHQAPGAETIHVIYVTDEEGRLLDDIRLRRLLLTEPTHPVSELMAGEPVALSAFDDEGFAVSEMKRTGYFVLPVVDSERRLIGVVTADDVLEIAVEEATIDIHKGGAIRPLDTSLTDTKVYTLYARRVPWLLVLVFMNIFSGAGIAHYEELIESVVALVFFLPLLIDSGGNAGSQAATLVIRSMALGELKMIDYLKVVFKEMRVALALGLSMALAVAVIGYFRAGPEVALVVATSMTVIVFVGSLIGMSLPFLFKKINVDPATASGPVVTSLADILGVLIYLGIASTMLGNLAS